MKCVLKFVKILMEVIGKKKKKLWNTISNLKKKFFKNKNNRIYYTQIFIFTPFWNIYIFHNGVV